MEKEKLETIAFSIISASGQARSAAFEALKLAKKNEPAASQKALDQAYAQLKSAQSFQQQLLEEELDGSPVELSLLQVHAQDHLMNTLFSIDLIREMMDLIPQEDV